MSTIADEHGGSGDTVNLSASELAELWREARSRTLALVADLSDEQMIGPRLAIVNPPLWEIGHVAWTQEFWVLRHLGKKAPLVEGSDALYNSTEVIHDTRWELKLPSRRETLVYMDAVLDRAIERLGGQPIERNRLYFYLLVLFHEDMHDEAMAYTRQTLGYPPPKFSAERRGQAPKGTVLVEPGGSSPSPSEPVPFGGPLPGDVEVPAGNFMLGGAADEPFVFDNEKWAHPVAVKSFRIARAPVTNGEFAEFVESGGYRRKEL